VNPIIYTFALTVREWRELLPHLTQPEFRTQIIQAIDEHADNDAVRVRVDHLLT
jgi:hypothetical protein